MKDVLQYLGGGDLRSIGRSSMLEKKIKTQDDFDSVFEFLTNPDRLVVMRAADLLEKVSKRNPEWLKGHKGALIRLLTKACDKELKWHLALMCPRLPLTPSQAKTVWNVLSKWVLDSTESKIVRVNSLEGLKDLTSVNDEFGSHWISIVSKIKEDNTPSLKARLRNLI